MEFILDQSTMGKSYLMLHLHIENQNTNQIQNSQHSFFHVYARDLCKIWKAEVCIYYDKNAFFFSKQ